MRQRGRQPTETRAHHAVLLTIVNKESIPEQWNRRDYSSAFSLSSVAGVSP